MRDRQKYKAVRVMANNIWFRYNITNDRVLPRDVRRRYFRRRYFCGDMFYKPLEIADLEEKYWLAIEKYWYRKRRPFAKKVRRIFRTIGYAYLKKHGEKHIKWWPYEVKQEGRHD